MTIDVLCHILYLLIAISMILIGRKKRAGWLLYVFVSACWVLVGIELRLSSIAIWSLIFTFVGIVSWKRRNH